MIVNIMYEGIDFEVEGTWEPEYGASLTEPGGGGFEVEDIMINGVSVCAVLSSKADEKICQIAYEQVREMV